MQTLRSLDQHGVPSARSAIAGCSEQGSQGSQGRRSASYVIENNGHYEQEELIDNDFEDGTVVASSVIEDHQSDGEY